jgi:hypothetical protein
MKKSRFTEEQILFARTGPKRLDSFFGDLSGASIGGGLSTGPRVRRLRRTRMRGTVGNPVLSHAACCKGFAPKYTSSGLCPSRA